MSQDVLLKIPVVQELLCPRLTFMSPKCNLSEIKRFPALKQLLFTEMETFKLEQLIQIKKVYAV